MKKILIVMTFFIGSVIFSQTIKAETPASNYTATTTNGLGSYAFDIGQTLDGHFWENKDVAGSIGQHIYSSYEQRPIYNLILDKSKPPVKAIFWCGVYYTKWHENLGYYDDYSNFLFTDNHLGGPLNYDSNGKLAYTQLAYHQDGSSWLAYPRLDENPYWVANSDGSSLSGVTVYDEKGKPTMIASPPPFPIELVSGPDSGESYGPIIGGSYNNNGQITYIPSTQIMKPVDPQNPSIPVQPLNPDGNKPVTGTAGALSLDFASSFDFGKQEITSVDKTYFAAAQKLDDGTTRTNYVQVTDNRGTLAGWSLNATASEFTTPENDKLTGAQITLSEAQIASVSDNPADISQSTTVLTPNMVSTTILGASNQHGSGTNLLDFGGDGKGNQDKATTAVKLDVSGKSVKLSKTYVSNLTWNLSDVPANG